MTICDISLGDRPAKQSWRRLTARRVVFLLTAFTIVGLAAIDSSGKAAAQAVPVAYKAPAYDDASVPGTIAQRTVDQLSWVAAAPGGLSPTERGSAALRASDRGELTPVGASDASSEVVGTQRAGEGGARPSGQGSGTTGAAPRMSVHGALAKALQIAGGSA